MIGWLLFLGVGAMWLILSGRNAVNITDYAKRAGFTGNDLIIAVAIAYAESSGDPNARGDRRDENDPDTATSYGLWQIHWTVHPETYVNNPTELFDPQNNANAAFIIYTRAGNTFRDWSTFDPRNGTTPRYLSYVNKATQEVSA